MTKENWVWNKEKDISKEEKRGIKKYIDENIGTNENLENFDSVGKEVILSVNKNELEEKIWKLEEEIISLTKEIEKLEKEMTNSDTDKEYNEKMHGIQDRISLIDKNNNKINQIKEKIESLKNDLLTAGKIVHGVGVNKENLN